MWLAPYESEGAAFSRGETLMRIKRHHVSVLVVGGIGVGIGLALLLALFVGVGAARAVDPPSGCGTAPNGASYCCEGNVYSGQCWGPAVWDYFGCERVGYYQVCHEVPRSAAYDGRCYTVWFCFAPTGGAIWLADVMEGPWYEVQVNGPPWVVTEENMEAFAAMVGVEDWHDMWVRSGDGYPQHVGNTIMQRDARMDELCAE
jgi:hypothetical protein